MGADRERGAGDDGVAEVLERVRAGVRQRQSELACLDADLGRLPASLATVRSGAELEEPSLDREGGSSLVDLVQKVTYHLFSRRHHRSLLQQQTRFNRSVAVALEDLHTRQQRLGEALRELRDAVDGSSRGPSG